MCLGIPGRITEITDVDQLRAAVTVGGVRREVSLAMIGLDEPDGARVGDWVVVHLGFAMAKMDEAEAQETLDSLEALSDMYERELTDHSAQDNEVQAHPVFSRPS